MSEPQLTGPSFGPATGNPPKQLVVLLHGRGANGNDLIGLAPMLAEHLPDALFLAPDAPDPCEGAPFGLQWFSLTDRSPENIAAGVRGVAPAIDAFLDHHLAQHGLSDGDLALFGFSQGSMMALHIGMRRTTAPAAVLGYSGLLAAADSLADEITVRPPVLLVHGEADEIVPHAALAAAETTLRDAGVTVEAISRPGLGHGIDDDGVRRAITLLDRVFTSA
ncbi:MAG: prolyl oligopeptidase family serine peptidase [Rhodospirillaceae bacterium]|jgi:phospholipase/carboxylesterase|nr:prolyl oligopeptidase family serine peptidase [Rhodospirillaceae bacterium]MBT5945364.1 prolyl oligopeptidase family serine peptidase [Rhodospirillaceae bacterium]MBT6404873.1 prolyl oligopeptidase family serine peptidase [Rhodospirillaceae bacterium]MBT6536596.1 prolyl oligopeptidase family serine peptidase [Rhodospirillaceae bacterium]MBT7360875.1 prolyl oligopeptidase family serine peptidase [Rhodospirillaceae bacterium]